MAKLAGNRAVHLSQMGHRVNRRELMLMLGAAMTASGALRAQQKAMPVIGYLGSAADQVRAGRQFEDC
jgi:hypothetical protein